MIIQKWMYKIDFFFNKVVPKKFIVFIIATLFAFPFNIITGGQWMILACAYFGINYGQKILERLSKNGNRNDIDSSGNSGNGRSSSWGVYMDDEKS